MIFFYQKKITPGLVGKKNSKKNNSMKLLTFLLTCFSMFGAYIGLQALMIYSQSVLTCSTTGVISGLLVGLLFISLCTGLYYWIFYKFHVKRYTPVFSIMATLVFACIILASVNCNSDVTGTIHTAENLHVFSDDPVPLGFLEANVNEFNVFSLHHNTTSVYWNRRQDALVSVCSDGFVFNNCEAVNICLVPLNSSASLNTVFGLCPYACSQPCREALTSSQWMVKLDTFLTYEQPNNKISDTIKKATVAALAELVKEYPTEYKNINELNMIAMVPADNLPSIQNSIKKAVIFALLMDLCFVSLVLFVYIVKVWLKHTVFSENNIIQTSEMQVFGRVQSIDKSNHTREIPQTSPFLVDASDSEDGL